MTEQEILEKVRTKLEQALKEAGTTLYGFLQEKHNNMEAQWQAEVNKLIESNARLEGHKAALMQGELDRLLLVEFGLDKIEIKRKLLKPLHVIKTKKRK